MKPSSRTPTRDPSAGASLGSPPLGTPIDMRPPSLQSSVESLRNVETDEEDSARLNSSVSTSPRLGFSYATAALAVASKDNKIKELKEKMIEDFKADEPDFKIKTKDVREPKEQHGPGAHFGSGMSQGEIEYSGAMKGHRAYYIICPEEMESTEAVLMHMFNPDSVVGWKLKPPNLTVYGLGGRDHYTKWIDGSYYDTENGTDVWSDGKEGKREDARRAKFNRRLQEIAGGVCQAVTECGGWFDFGGGGRGGMSEVIADGLKTYWASLSTIAGHKDPDLGVVIAIRRLNETIFADQFVSNAAPLDTDDGHVNPDAIPTQIKKRVMYPATTHLLYPHLFSSAMNDDQEVDTSQWAADENEAERRDGSVTSSKNKQRLEEEVIGEARYAVSKGILSNVLTHVIFVQNEQLYQKMNLEMSKLATRAIIFANGSRKLIMPGIDGKVLNAASRGIPVVCLHHTGGAAEAFGHALIKKLDPSAAAQPPTKMESFISQKLDLPGNYRLPDNVSDDSCLVLDASSDSVEKVIDKLTLVLSSVQDDEMREVGNAKSERERLFQAWDSFALYSYNSRIQLWFAWILHLLLVLSNILTTAIALVYWGVSSDQMPSWIDPSYLHLILPLMPVISGILITLISKFAPIQKWAALKSGAEGVKSEIYLYRARVGDYRPRVKNEVDIMTKVRLLEEARKETLMNQVVSNMSGSPDAGVLVEFNSAIRAKMASSSKTSAASRQEETAVFQKVEARRSRFADNIAHIHKSVMSSEVRGSHLVQAPNSELEQTFNSLHRNRGGGNVSKAHVTLAIDEAEMSKKGGKADLVIDNGVGILTASDYFQFRLLKLIEHYETRSPELSRRLGAFHFSMVIVTALTTALALTAYSRWVPLIVAFGAAMSNTTEWEQLQNRHQNVNQSLEVLVNLRTWWESLSMVEKRMPANKEHLVKMTEDNASSEIRTFFSLQPKSIPIDAAINDLQSDAKTAKKGDSQQAK